MNAPRAEFPVPVWPWPFYAVLVIISFAIVFVCFKYAGGKVTPILFAFLANLATFIGHSLNLIRKKDMTVFQCSALPVPMWGLAALTGGFVASNDTMSALMFAREAPLSVAMPVFGAGTVFLSVVFGLIWMREKISAAQVTGLTLAGLGIVLLNV